MVNEQLLDQSDWITIKEAADLTGYSKNNIQQLIRSGKIPTRRTAWSVRVNRASLLADQRQRPESLPPLYPSQTALAAIETRTPLARQQRNAEAIRLLTEWTNATEEEAVDQRDTLAYLVEHLDQQRSSYREIFPAELKQQLH